VRWADLAGRTRLPTVIVLLIGVAVWSLLSQRFGEYLFPSPGRVLAGLVRVTASGELWVHVSATLYRITLGFSAAVIISLLAGFLLARIGWAKMVVKDLTAILNSTSVFVWIVLAMIWFGLTDTAPIFTTFMITLPVMLSNIIEGVESIDTKLLEMSRVYKLSDIDRFVHITVPGTIPYLVAGMKVGFALGLRVSVVAEIFGVSTGIGYIMNFSRDILRTDMVFVWALVLIAIMVLVEKTLFDALSRRVNAWR
jgi:ABC-type nitrate/sulfonate/bicarbonate transport system permease component